jgi:transcriptional regulator with XRE-family HTH domain
MAHESYLAELRKQARLTQSELGEKLGMRPSYAQRRISQVESGVGRLTAIQLQKLTEVLKEAGIDVLSEELERHFADYGSNILELTERLANTDRPALMCLCYTGDASISSDRTLIETFTKALQRNLYCALFVPVPPPPYSGPPSAWHLESYWQRVWRNAVAICKRFLESGGNFAVYGPQSNALSPFVMPPFFSRYFFLLEPKDRDDYEKSLYLMVETAESKQLEFIATLDGPGQYSQVVDWEQYFIDVIGAWRRDYKFPQGICGYWKQWEEMPLSSDVSVV